MENMDSGHQIKKDPKTAILLVTPGTTRNGAEKILGNCVKAFRSAYPDAVVRYAIASELVRQIITEEGVVEKSPLGALAELIDEGFAKIIVQPLYITPGDGLHSLYTIVNTMNSFSGKHGLFGIEGILIGKPLLMNTKDYNDAAKAISSYFGTPGDGEALVLVSSVDEGGADPSLCQLQLIMDETTAGNIIIGSSYGYPGTDWVMKRLKHINAKKVTLGTLALIPGKHAEYELSGDNPESWNKILENAGYEVSVSEKVLGESPEVAGLLIDSLGEVGRSHGFL